MEEQKEDKESDCHEKNNTCISSRILLAFVPWTILLVRTQEWALKSPAAEITIGIYSVEIMLAFLYCLILYTKKRHKDVLASIGLVANGLYAVGILGLIGINIPGWLGNI